MTIFNGKWKGCIYCFRINWNNCREDEDEVTTGSTEAETTPADTNGKSRSISRSWSPFHPVLPCASIPNSTATGLNGVLIGFLSFLVSLDAFCLTVLITFPSAFVHFCLLPLSLLSLIIGN